MKVLLWGYPSGMQGKQHLRFLQNLLDISFFAAEPSQCWQDYYYGLHNIGHIGISTITKLAYFFKHRFDGMKALILDRRLIGICAEERWAELRRLQTVTYNNAWRNYSIYLETMSDISAQIGCRSDQVEFFLFSYGSSF